MSEQHASKVSARRTHVVRTGAAFGGTGGSGDHLDLWSYNDRNELTGSERYADTDPETPEDPVAALDRAYAYDSIGNRVTSEDGATPTEWEYDTNALNQYERVDTVGDALIRQGYTFDADGNLGEQWLIGDATCDGVVNNFDTDWFVAAILDPENNEMPEGYPGDQACWDRRLEWADVDGNGAINSFDVDPYVDVLVSGGAVARVFTWNAENKLVMAAPIQTEGIHPPLGSQRVSFVYDYLGRRVEKLVETWTAGSPDDWVETTRRRYIYDGWLLLLELDALDSNAVVRQYTWGLDLAGLSGSVNDRTSAGGIGGLLAVHDETVNSGEDYLYLYDANGNVGQLVALEDDYGDATDDDWHADRLVARYEYDAYGRITGPDTDDDGDWRDDGGAYATTNVMRFSTKPWDDELGWGNWGERLYEPRIGRWTSRDPIHESGGYNLYSYCLNAPSNHDDPRGLACRICYSCTLIGWTLSSDNSKRDCDYFCSEVSRSDAGMGQGEGCADLETAGELPPARTAAITEGAHTTRTWREYMLNCTPANCPPGSTNTCRLYFKSAAPSFDRNCSRLTCKQTCRNARVAGRGACELLKGTYKLACKAAIALGAPTCEGLCEGWCNNP